ncbi:MauE/DoxX family redox-associated membrane protein [Mariniflexile sp. HNIBRBA6329]|uniref:MauE/DoxX family redox-associated membrane protein n=1 Tax=Mariniflexile sp. HNIBRBA6329 TaxID=3373088 RepID=UPI003746C912
MDRSKTCYLIVPKIIGLLFIMLFVYAATSKLVGFERFHSQLAKSPFISTYANWIAWMVPIVELFITGLFLFPKTMLLAFYSSLALMTLFTSYIFLVLNFSDSIPCACGGVISNLGWKAHFVFNIVFIILAFIGIIITRKRNKFNN